MSKTVEKMYQEKVIQATLKKVQEYKENGISLYTQKLYDAVKDQITETLEEFACSTSNWNPGKCGKGEEAQLDYLKQYKHLKVVGLPNNGKNSIKLVEKSGKLFIRQTKDKSNIDGIKSFDAKLETNNQFTFFVLKTVDIGSFSDNEGGGHQDNVLNELKIFISVVKGHSLTYNGKPVDFCLLVNGRSASDIISACNIAVGNDPNIKVCSCEDL